MEKVFITISEVAQILKCTPRTVQHQLKEIDTFDNLVKQGFAKNSPSKNGNKIKLFDKEWITSISDKTHPSKKTKIE